MWFKLSMDIVTKLGINAAILLEHFDNINPANNIARLNISEFCNLYKIPLSTGQRVVKELTTKGYLTKYSCSTYRFNDKFYNNFPEYKVKPKHYGKRNI